MAHQNFQEAIEQLSNVEDFRTTLLSNPDQIKSKFDLNAEDMTAINSQNSLIEGATKPAPGYCCCCC
jgi:hypothetical protein